MSPGSTRLALHAGGGSRKGAGREKNEDDYYIDPQGRFWIVADGIGGSRAGEVASHLAVRLLSQSLAALRRSRLPAAQALDSLRRCFRDTNELIITARGEDPRLRNMGTTAAVALVQGNTLYAAGLGDSRVYLIRGGTPTQLTVDQTVAQALVEAGILAAGTSQFHPYRNVLQKYLGCEEFGDGPCTGRVALQANDRILLATDGLTDVVGDEQLALIITESATPQRAVDSLSRTARNHGSKDDITCVTVFVEPRRFGRRM